MTNLKTPMCTDAFARRLALIIAAGALTGLAACNTVEGAGRDIEAAGDGIEDAAQDAKN